VGGACGANIFVHNIIYYATTMVFKRIEYLKSSKVLVEYAKLRVFIWFVELC
jgi:hypothetical protein